MKLTITIKMDNAAFDDSQEAGRILRDLAEKLDNEGAYAGLVLSARDTNGNTVAHLMVTDDVSEKIGGTDPD